MMISGTESTKHDQDEKKRLLESDKTAASSTRNKSTLVSKSEKKTEVEKSEKSTASNISKKSTGRRGPKMSDGTEFDTGPFGWIFSFIFLAFLWSLTILAAVLMVWFHLSRLDSQYPTYFGQGSFLGDIPRATFDPNPKRFNTEDNKNLMQWDIYNFDSYINYLIRYKIILKGYSDQTPACTKDGVSRKKGCKFDTSAFGDCEFTHKNLERGMGFNKGEPCIMLKLNKIVGWVPEFLTANTTGNETCGGSRIKFECTATPAHSIQFEFYPKSNPGIPACYYPFANQQNYEQPYTMVKLKQLPSDEEVTIECYPTNDPIAKLGNDKRNEIKFHLKVSKNGTSATE